MKLPHALLAVLFVFALLSPATRTHAAELRRLQNDGRTLDYLLVLPVGFDPSKAYPVLLALPPGDQTRSMAESALERYWEAEAASRGWVVVAPFAPEPAARGGKDRKSFHNGLERALPFLLDEVAKSVTFEGGRAHLAGVSHGGKSAYRAATEYPTRFLSLTVLPGFPPDDRAELGLRSLKALPGGVSAYVGDNDPNWLSESRRTKQKLDAYGVKNTLEVWPASGHVVNIRPLELFDMLDRKRLRPITYTEPSTPAPVVPSVPAAPAPPDPSPQASEVPPAPARPDMPAPGATEATPAPDPAPPITPEPRRLTPIDILRETRAVETVLDDFHDAAAKADESRYFGHFSPEGVFLGTDATERWDVESFRAFAHPYFARGQAWTYTPTVRRVTLSPIAAPGSEVAWFDELLENEKVGVTRGSGVLRKIDGAWRISQYNLSIPVPNDLVEEFVPRIRQKRGSPAAPDR